MRRAGVGGLIVLGALVLAPAAGAANTDALETCVGTSPCSSTGLPTGGVVGSTAQNAVGAVCDLVATPAPPEEVEPPSGAHACWIDYHPPSQQVSVVSVPGVAGVAVKSTTSTQGFGFTDYKIQVRLLR